MSKNKSNQHLLKKEICLDYWKDLTLQQQNALVWLITELQREEDLEPKFARGSLQECAARMTDATSANVIATNDFLFRDGAYETMIDKVIQVGTIAIRALILLQKKRKVAWKLRKKKPIEYAEDNAHENGKEKETQIIN